MLKDEEVINFLATIEELGREQHVELKTSRLQVDGIDDTFEELVVEITITGSYDSVLHMLSLFETFPYQSYVSIFTDNQVSWSGNFTIHVTKFKKT